MAFSLTGVLLLVNLTRFRFLSLVSVARKEAAENLRDPVIILDRRSTLAYINAAGKAAFGLSTSSLGMPLADLGPALSRIADLGAGEERELLVGPSGEGTPPRRFEARASSILMGKKTIGRTLILYDVTQRAAAEEALKEANRQLELGIAERTKVLESTNVRLTEELAHRTRAERRLSHEALHDPLTGLPNRSLLLSRIELAIARYQRNPKALYGLLFLDIDNFKQINDTYGHNAGDAFLTEIAQRLKKMPPRRGYGRPPRGRRVRRSPRRCRISRGHRHRGGSYRGTNFSIPIMIGQNSMVPTASVGLLHARPEIAEAGEALRDADIAMYRAKAEGKNKRVEFNTQLLTRVLEKNMLTRDLRGAIASGGIGLAFQPIVYIDGGLAGWEVLARWRHEEIGMISPDRFIPIAEESGLIVPLGTFVLLETLRTAALLRDSGLLIEKDGKMKYFFSVNVSGGPACLGRFRGSRFIQPRPLCPAAIPSSFGIDRKRDHTKPRGHRRKDKASFGKRTFLQAGRLWDRLFILGLFGSDPPRYRQNRPKLHRTDADGRKESNRSRAAS